MSKRAHQILAAVHAIVAMVPLYVFIKGCTKGAFAGNMPLLAIILLSIGLSLYHYSRK